MLGYLLLTGTLPFAGSVAEVLWAHVHDTPPTLSERRREHVDGAVEALIARAMSKDPVARHASAAAFRYELKTVMHMLGIHDLRPSQPMRAAKRDASLASVLHRSRLPQVLVSADGDIAWANPAFACAYLLAEAFSESGWDMRPGEISEISGLPAHVYRADGESHLKPCAEALLSEDAAEAILDRGLMPLVSVKGTDAIRLVRFQSIAMPAAPLAGRWS